MTFLALPWFVLATTGSPTRMSIVLAAELAPVAVLGIPSGVVIARWGARRTMLVADLARVPLIASIPLLHELGLLSFPLLLVLVALVGRLHRAVLRLAGARSCRSSSATTSRSSLRRTRSWKARGARPRFSARPPRGS